MAPCRLLLGVLALQLCGLALAVPRGCPTGTSNYTYAVPALPLPSASYMPGIDNETMVIHSTRHVGASVATLNSILDRYPSLRNVSLADIVWRVGTTFDRQNGILANDSIAIRNHAGSVYNHGFFWNVMTYYNTSTPANSNLSSELTGKIVSAFNGTTGMTTALRSAANSVFGSGWAWVVVRSNGTLGVVTTPNQDNPVMRGYVSAANRGIPILGVDVWEHAYYIRYRNFRSTYLSNWVNLINWKSVQRNYDLAMAGKVDDIWCSIG